MLSRNQRSYLGHSAKENWEFCKREALQSTKDELIQSMCTPIKRFKTCWMKARKRKQRKHFWLISFKANKRLSKCKRTFVFSSQGGIALATHGINCRNALIHSHEHLLWLMTCSEENCTLVIRSGFWSVRIKYEVAHPFVLICSIWDTKSFCFHKNSCTSSTQLCSLLHLYLDSRSSGAMQGKESRRIERLSFSACSERFAETRERRLTHINSVWTGTMKVVF